MKGFRAALWMELLKVRKTKIFLISVLFFAFIGLMMGLLMYVSMNPELADRSTTISTKTSFIGEASWISFFDLLLQLILTLGVIGFGIVTSWVFGREFSEKVIKDLLALPVSRTTIINAKFLVLAVWGLVLTLAILVSAMLSGWIIRVPGWAEASFASFFVTFLLCALMNILLITPVAFIASAGRGYLLPISFVILSIIITQLIFVGIPVLSPWLPWALPALFSGVAGEVAPQARIVSYVLFGIMVLAGYAGTIAWWRYADHR